MASSPVIPLQATLPICHPHLLSVLRAVLDSFFLSTISVFTVFVEGFSPLLVGSVSSVRESSGAGDPCEL